MESLNPAGVRSVPPVNGAVVQIVKLAMGTGNPGAALSSSEGAALPGVWAAGAAATGSLCAAGDRDSGVLSGFSATTVG